MDEVWISALAVIVVIVIVLNLVAITGLKQYTALYFNAIYSVD